MIDATKCPAHAAGHYYITIGNHTFCMDCGKPSKRAQETDHAEAEGSAMTETEFKAIRKKAALTQTELAARLRIEDLRTIRRYETGDRSISGPVSLLMELLRDGVLP